MKSGNCLKNKSVNQVTALKKKLYIFETNEPSLCIPAQIYREWFELLKDKKQFSRPTKNSNIHIHFDHSIAIIMQNEHILKQVVKKRLADQFQNFAADILNYTFSSNKISISTHKFFQHKKFCILKELDAKTNLVIGQLHISVYDVTMARSYCNTY